MKPRSWESMEAKVSSGKLPAWSSWFVSKILSPSRSSQAVGFFEGIPAFARFARFGFAADGGGRAAGLGLGETSVAPRQVLGLGSETVLLPDRSSGALSQAAGFFQAALAFASFACFASSRLPAGGGSWELEAGRFLCFGVSW